MPDLQESTKAPDLGVEIGRSLASVWARYAGARPGEATTEIDTDVVRWIMPDAAGELKKGMSEVAEAAEPPAQGKRAPTVAGYEREISSVVARATHRRVVALIRKDNAKTGVASQVFILERVRAKQ